MAATVWTRGQRCSGVAALAVLFSLLLTATAWSASGLNARPNNTTCLAGDAPGTSAVTLDRVWPELSAVSPFDVHPTPGTSDEFYVIARSGRMYRFVPGAAPVKVLDINARIGIDDYSSNPGNAYEPGGSEHWGLVSFALHPDFANNGQVFVLYNGRQAGQQTTTSFVDRYTRQSNGSFGSRLPIFTLQQPLTVLHHLGHLAFGPDGYLYIGSGDSTENGWDPNVNPPPGQDLGSFSGKLLRVDVDHPWPGLNYGIPADNPWINSNGPRWEIYALGLRNPWRFSFDPFGGTLWLGDVGYASYEEISRIDNGKNYGWPVFEANSCVHPGWVNPATGQTCSTAIPSVAPVAQFAHGGAYMGVIGGHVYRGSAISGLAGKYVFGLYGPNTIRTIDPNNNNRVELLVDGTPEITSYFTDSQNEIYAVASWEANVYKLVPSGGAGDAGIPQYLSQTGCVSATNPAVAKGMVPFAVNSQLWSDGANKKRFAALPNTARIDILSDGDFSFPAGSVLMKTFMFNGVPFETRFLKRHNGGGWAGYTYRWEGNDARLVDRQGEDVQVRNNAGTLINWRYPSRGECLVCHTQAAKFALGPEIAQLNGTFRYPATGRTANQLETWDAIGMFSGPLPATRPALAVYTNTSLPAVDRARSYLHSNCAGCHRPESTGNRSTMDLRYYTPMSQMNVCNANWRIAPIGPAGSKLITPTRPDLSIVPLRMKIRGDNQMPPLGTTIRHTAGVNLINTWIKGMDANCN